MLPVIFIPNKHGIPHIHNKELLYYGSGLAIGLSLPPSNHYFTASVPVETKMFEQTQQALAGTGAVPLIRRQAPELEV